MLILGIEPASVILSKTKYRTTLKCENMNTARISRCRYGIWNQFYYPFVLSLNLSREDPGVKSRMCPPYPQRVVKGV